MFAFAVVRRSRAGAAAVARGLPRAAAQAVVRRALATLDSSDSDADFLPKKKAPAAAAPAAAAKGDGHKAVFPAIEAVRRAPPPRAPRRAAARGRGLVGER